MVNSNESKIGVEVRFFGQLMALAEAIGLSTPCFFELKSECSAIELADRMGVPTDEIEAVFVDGVAKPLDEGRINPGNRVGFIPYGVPGPYRVLLGIRKNKKITSKDKRA